MSITHKDFDFGSYQRPDGETFAINARLYDLPSQYDYWLASYDADHNLWGHMRFTLTIPKGIASTFALAEALLQGRCLAQVKSGLLGASGSGRDLAPCFSIDGWVLL